MRTIDAKQNQKEAISEAVKILNEDGIIIFPTETCYGVAVDPTNQVAVDKLLEYKRRPEGKAISVAVADLDMARHYVNINDTAEDVYSKLLPGPITVISVYRGDLARGIVSEYNTLGIRLPDFKFTQELIKAFGKPITATSANSSGKKTPYKIIDILDNISNKQKELIDLVLDFGELPKNPPSTVIDTTKSDLQILRKGTLLPTRLVEEVSINSDIEMQEKGYLLIKNEKKNLKDKAIVILFNAELGTGKTQFTKGIAKGLRILDNVNSPTYSLMKEYDYDGGKLIHLDAWRLEDDRELKNIGLDSYIKPGNVISVEWSGGTQQYFAELNGDSTVLFIEIEIAYISQNSRKLKIYR